MAPPLVLVKVGEGKCIAFDDDAAVLSFTSGALLLALAERSLFAVKLRGVPLDDCAVLVRAHASLKWSSAVEATPALELEGGETLGALSAGLAGNLFIHVQLPMSTTTRGPGEDGESTAH